MRVNLQSLHMLYLRGKNGSWVGVNQGGPNYLPTTPPTPPTAPCRPQTIIMGKNKGRLSEEMGEQGEGSSSGGEWSEGEDADAEYNFWPQ